MLRAGVRLAPSFWKESCSHLRRERVTHLWPSLRTGRKMHRDVSAFSVSSVFAPRVGVLIGSHGNKCFSALSRAHGGTENSTSFRLTIRCTPRCTLTEEQKTFIFQRSPYHEYRLRRYGVTSSDGGSAVESPQETTDLSGSTVTTSEAKTADAELSDREYSIPSLQGRAPNVQPRVDGASSLTVRNPESELSHVSRKSKTMAKEREQIDRYSMTGESDSKGKDQWARRESVASHQKEDPVGETASTTSGPMFASHDELLGAFYDMTGDPLEKDGGRIVVYRGNPRARLMIIGEAPGEQEDIEGEPFVGKAGQLLDKIFQYGGFDMKEQVYITNIAKRRPANNRTPGLEEVEYYLPYLLDEIRLIDPAIIVLAGRIASQALLGPDIRITKVRGQWFRHGEGGPPIMPVFHPAYLLRKPTAKYDMVADIEEIRAKYLELVPEEPLKPLKKV